MSERWWALLLVALVIAFVAVRLSRPYGGLWLNDDYAPKQVTVVTR